MSSCFIVNGNWSHNLDPLPAPRLFAILFKFFVCGQCVSLSIYWFLFFYTIWCSDIFSLELASDANFSRPAIEIEKMWEGKVGKMEWTGEWSKGNSVAQYIQYVTISMYVCPMLLSVYAQSGRREKGRERGHGDADIST